MNWYPLVCLCWARHCGFTPTDRTVCAAARVLCGCAAGHGPCGGRDRPRPGPAVWTKQQG